MTTVKSTFAARREDWPRHVVDLQTGTYEGAAERPAREEIFREAFALTTPVAVRVLEALDQAYLGGRGKIDTTPPRHVPASDGLTGAARQPVTGMVGSWSLTWPELEQARSRLTGLQMPPVQIFAMFPDDFTHPHLALFDLGPPRRWIACWPLQVRSPDEAERQEAILAAIAEGEMHERTFEGDLNWRLLDLGESPEAGSE
jgi:hypothetical protein